MSKISTKDFFKRFRLSREVLDPTVGYRKAYYRDVLFRRNVILFKYSYMSEQECIETVDKAISMQCPGLTVDILGYSVFWNNRDKQFDLFLVYNEATTLEEFVFSKATQKLKLLSVREIIYIFLSVSKFLVFLKSKRSYHGNIDECHLYVDQDHKLKMLLLPDQEPAVVRLSKYKKILPSLNSPALLAPEMLDYLRGASSMDFSITSETALRADMFSLGLMTIRLISPRALKQGYNLESFHLDMGRLYMLVDTLGTFVDSSFAGTIKQCLSPDPHFRPEVIFLVEEIEATHDMLPEDLQAVANRDFLEEASVLSSYSPDDLQEMPVDEIDRLANIPADSTFLLPRKPLLRALKTLHRGESTAPVFMSPSSGGLDRLRTECLLFLEHKLFDSLPHHRRQEGTEGGRKYQCKIMGEGEQIGFILHPHKDVYFGYLQACRPEDAGMLFLAQGGVYIGQFHQGKIHGEGMLWMPSGMCLQGQWVDNQMDGDIIATDISSGQQMWCVYRNGQMVTQNEMKGGQTAQIPPSLEELYREGFKLYDPVKEIFNSFMPGNERSRGNMGSPSRRAQRMAQQALEESRQLSPEGENSPSPTRNMAGKVRERFLRRKSKQNEHAPKRSKRSKDNTRIPEFMLIPERQEIRGKAQVDALNLLEHPNRVFTIPNYYEDCVHPRDRLRPKVLAKLDSYTFGRPRLYSPGRGNGHFETALDSVPERRNRTQDRRTRQPDSPRAIYQPIETETSHHSHSLSRPATHSEHRDRETLTEPVHSDHSESFQIHSNLESDPSALGESIPAHPAHSKSPKPREDGRINFKDLSRVPRRMIKTSPGGEYTGQSTLVFTTGDKYMGMLSQGIPHGQGTFYPVRGEKITGRWVRGLYK